MEGRISSTIDALGLSLFMRNCHKVIRYTGEIEGFRKATSFYPDDGLIVIALGNVDTADPSKLSCNLAEAALYH